MTKTELLAAINDPTTPEWLREKLKTELEAMGRRGRPRIHATNRERWAKANANRRKKK